MATGLTEHCTQGHTWAGEPKGRETTLGSLKAYQAEGKGDSAIILITDIFGWEAKNNRLAADGIAEASGITVYVPDFFTGDSFQPGDLPAFLSRHAVAQTEPILYEAVTAVKANHAGKIGAVGYCWGAKYSLRLGAQGHVAAAVQCHPSLVDAKEDSLASMQAACLFLLAQGDKAFEGSRRQDTEAAIRGSGVPLELKEFAGVNHGFAVRCNEGDTHAAKARDDALAQTATWFTKYLN